MPKRASLSKMTFKSCSNMSTSVNKDGSLLNNTIMTHLKAKEILKGSFCRYNYRSVANLINNF